MSGRAKLRIVRPTDNLQVVAAMCERGVTFEDLDGYPRRTAER